MTKLFDLHNFLNDDTGTPRPEQIHAVLESGDPIISFSTASDDVVMLHHRYDGRITMDRASVELSHVLALIAVWMNENGGEFDEFLGWSGEPVEDRLDDLDFRFHFEEEIRYIADPEYTGKDKITWSGVVYKPGSLTPDRATDLDSVNGSPA